MTEAELKDLCSLWQKRLRLQDWKIEAKFVSSDELEELGSSRPHSDSKMALIRLAIPDSYDTSGGFYKAFPKHYDPERTLVHELLHCHFHDLFNIDADKHEQVMQEQAIEALTDALIDKSE